MPDNKGKKYKRDESHQGTRLDDDLIIQTLIKNNGNKSVTARELGCAYETIYHHMKRPGMQEAYEVGFSALIEKCRYATINQVMAGERNGDKLTMLKMYDPNVIRAPIAEQHDESDSKPTITFNVVDNKDQIINDLQKTIDELKARLNDD